MACAIAVAAGVFAVLAASAHAQGTAQLDPVAKSYTLGRFAYEAPLADGWRQLANAKDSLQLVYAEQLEDNKINTRCHVVLEIHELPADSGVPGVAELAEVGRRQMGDRVKAEMAAISPVAAVPGVENIYTYRFLLHGPPEMGSDYYQVYYVALAPDKTQYVVIQLNTKDMDYENQIYFQQFYATLARLKYQAPAAANVPGAGAAGSAGAGATTPAPPASGDAASTPQAK